ncbi:uroporphyrinogen-III synthase [Priestia megaterium]|uniref:uroporphyrinogen-III synthase n=1 Tax=Priestia megaterium TaxID=1404 RepID=UPI000BF6D6ED|nr:uroporphyrinogen-III synthase [Priestia megaterium]MED3867657.1 uroporphyrinogen-III synthase [Priestia megaterium]MED4066688.1 uroporphyrinogen-III synthase [Priestia megaterium]PER77351.1 uroporphyrinogen III synthase [Priestia megaterium]PEU58188.1 uroporphyrinogen III synthase [Priestia megaterium]PFP39456.1 uroporphyrinogen III synthase [Priestia megaterium]
MSHEAPLFLKKVLITREAKQAHSFAAQVKKLGGIPLSLPVLTFVRSNNEKEVEDVLLSIDCFDWIVFTSQNGISFFFEWLKELNTSWSVLKRLKVAAVGEKTAKLLEKHDVNVQLVPKEYVAESLLESLKANVSHHERVLLVRGQLARSVLKDGLKECEVTDLVVYQTIRNQDSERLVKQHLETGIDAITFTSSSTVRFFVESVKDIPNWLELINRTKVVCIGPITSQTASEYGIKHLVPNTYTINGMIDMLVSCFE